jgi:ribonuclease HI
MDTVTVWTDGSCLNNGTTNAMSGIGVYYEKNDSRNYSSALKIDKHTNNRAELGAIIYAICMDFGENHLYVCTDSMYSIKCITEYSIKWKRNGWITSKGTPVESSIMIKHILQLVSDRSSANLKTEFVHVKGHSTDTGNNAADLLARTGALNGLEGGRLRMLRKCGVPL